MSFGISGSHRSGKTTLAQAVAKAIGIHYLDASTTKIMQDTGFDPVAPGAPIEVRLHAQDYLLRRFIEMALKAPYPFISDRTPLDYVGYMLGEVTMHNTTAEQGARIDAYVRACLKATTEIFGCVMIVRPLGVYEIRSDKPPENLAYQRLVQAIIEGTAARLEDTTNYTNAVCIMAQNLEDRVGYVIDCIRCTEKQQAELRSQQPLH